MIFDAYSLVGSAPRCDAVVLRVSPSSNPGSMTFPDPSLFPTLLPVSSTLSYNKGKNVKNTFKIK